jgi:hypothetical protein
MPLQWTARVIFETVTMGLWRAEGKGTRSLCHPREAGPFHSAWKWIPAFAGMTGDFTTEKEARDAEKDFR